jgi:hypothetical protein
MNCSNHPNKEAKAICVSCGKLFCSDCLIVVDRKNYCKNCLKDKMEQKTSSIPYQQQQQSNDFFGFGKWSTNSKIGALALGLFLTSIIFIIVGGTSTINKTTGIGALLFVVSLVIGFIYAAGYPKDK